MRTYYIFKLDSFLYNRNKSSVYKILKNISKLSKNDNKLAKRIYNKFVVSISKEKINNYILKLHINDIYYKKNNDNHIVDTGYEISKLYVHNTYLKIETTNNISVFLKDIIPISCNMICIDFDSVDYFYLSELKTKLLV